MKLLLKSFIAICLLAFCSAGYASFDGHYYGNSPSGPFSGFEVNISGTTIYGTAFVRGGNDYIYFYTSGVDRSGNLRGSFRGDFSGTFTGKVLGNAVTITFKANGRTASLIGQKSTPGYAFSSIAGKDVAFTFLESNESRTYIDFYCDNPTTAEVYTYNTNTENEGYFVARYTYKKTGANTATITVAGVGTFTLTFRRSTQGTIVGPGINTTFSSYDLSDD